MGGEGEGLSGMVAILAAWLFSPPKLRFLTSRIIQSGRCSSSRLFVQPAIYLMTRSSNIKAGRRNLVGLEKLKFAGSVSNSYLRRAFMSNQPHLGASPTTGPGPRR